MRRNNYGMRAILVTMSLVLCGCGGVDFTGVWVGTLATTVDCGGGASTTAGEAKWTLAHRDNEVTITPDGTCGSFTADVMGNIAVIRAKSCPGSTVRFTGGRLEMLTMTRLDASIQATNDSSCTGRTSGVLNLQ